MLRQAGIIRAVLERQDTGRSPRASALTDLLYKGQGDAFAFAFEARLPPSVTQVLGESSQARLVAKCRRTCGMNCALRSPRGPCALPTSTCSCSAEHGNRPVPGEFPQGRWEDPGSLRYDDWQSVIHREGGPLTQFTPESTTQPVDLPPLRVPSPQLALGAAPPDETLFPAALWFASLLRAGVVVLRPGLGCAAQPRTARPAEAAHRLRAEPSLARPWPSGLCSEGIRILDRPFAHGTAAGEGHSRARA